MKARLCQRSKFLSDIVRAHGLNSGANAHLVHHDLVLLLLHRVKLRWGSSCSRGHRFGQRSVGWGGLRQWFGHGRLVREGQWRWMKGGGRLKKKNSQWGGE